MKRAPFLAPVLALALVLATAVPAVAAPATDSSVPITSVLDYPQARTSGGNFILHSRLMHSSANAGWCCRLYFDTDLNSMTGWFPSRGYEIVSCPNFSRLQNPVMHTLAGSTDGMGGAWCGLGGLQIDRNSLDLSVPLAMLGSGDGRFAWELMVFDSQGTWLGSYGGRIE